MLKKLNTSKDAFDTGRVSPIQEEQEAPTPQLGGESKNSLLASNSKKTALKDSSTATLDDKSPKVGGKDSQRRDSVLSRKVSIKEELKDETLSRKDTSKKLEKAAPEAGVKVAKSFSKSKQAMMREYYINDPNLSEA